MATLILRAEKGSPLTFQEVDNNFKALDQDNAALAQTVATLLSRTIWGRPLSGNITGPLVDVGDITGNAGFLISAGGTGNSIGISGSSGGHVVLNPLNIGGPGGTVQIRNGRFFRAAGDFFASINAEALTSNRSITLANGNTTLVSGTMVPTSGAGATGRWGISISGNVIGEGSVRVEAGGPGGDINLVPSGSGTVNAPTFNATSPDEGGFQGITGDSNTRPSFTWSGDLNTGIFRAGAGRVGVTSEGVEVLRFDRLGSSASRRILSPGGLEIVAGGENSSIHLVPSGTGRVNAPAFNATSTEQGGFQGAPSDSASAPSFTWSNDLNTGIFRAGSGRVGVSSEGVEVVRFDRLGGANQTVRRMLSPSGLAVEAGGALYLDSGSNNTFVNRLTSDTVSNTANVRVDPETGRLQQAISSLRYKKDVEDAELSYSEALVYGSRPVWYRSKAVADPAHYGFWGFIAEEVAEIDPRMVQWAFGEPNNVEYDLYTVHLVNVAQSHKQRLDALEARVEALEAQS
jgi:hypothetical protein